MVLRESIIGAHDRSRLEREALAKWDGCVAGRIDPYGPTPSEATFAGAAAFAPGRFE